MSLWTKPSLLCAFRLVAVWSLAIGVAACGDEVPETPANAVLDFANNVLLGDLDGALKRVCAERRAELLAGEDAGLVLFEFVTSSSSFTTDAEARVNGDRAVQPLDVRPAGNRDDRNNEPWEASLVREDGRWRVCQVAKVV